MSKKKLGVCIAVTLLCTIVFAFIMTDNKISSATAIGEARRYTSAKRSTS